MLGYKHENSNLSPHAHREKVVLMANAYDGPVEAQTGKSLRLVIHPVNGNPKARERLCLNKNKMAGA